jgi:hypothetical protein
MAIKRRPSRPCDRGLVATWEDVDDLVKGLPDARATTAHEGSPSWSAGRHQFARRRWDDDGRELLQSWSGDMSLGDALQGRREVFPVVHTFRYRVSTWAFLERLSRREVAELLLDSYAIRGGVKRGEAVDEAAYFARV